MRRRKVTRSSRGKHIFQQTAEVCVLASFLLLSVLHLKFLELSLTIRFQASFLSVQMAKPGSRIQTVEPRLHLLCSAPGEDESSFLTGALGVSSCGLCWRPPYCLSWKLMSCGSALKSSEGENTRERLKSPHARCGPLCSAAKTLSCCRYLVKSHIRNVLWPLVPPTHLSSPVPRRQGSHLCSPAPQATSWLPGAPAVCRARDFQPSPPPHTHTGTDTHTHTQTHSHTHHTDTDIHTLIHTTHTDTQTHTHTTQTQTYTHTPHTAHRDTQTHTPHAQAQTHTHTDPLTHTTPHTHTNTHTPLLGQGLAADSVAPSTDTHGCPL